MFFFSAENFLTFENPETLNILTTKRAPKFHVKRQKNKTTLNSIIIKFPYNARSDWLKQRALSENRARVDDGKLASSNFCFGILANLTQIKHPL